MLSEATPVTLERTSIMIGTPDAPLVSIIIPCYNQARYWAEAIKSALAQTHSHIQVVVVDDGSVDSTAEVASHYPEVRLVRQRNQGVAQARNVGLYQSSGDYVFSLDADDRLAGGSGIAPSCFAEHPEAGFVAGNIELISRDGAYLRSDHPPDSSGDQYEQLLKVNHVANSIAVMFRRYVFETVGGFTGSFLARGRL